MAIKAVIITGKYVQDHEFIYPYYRLQEAGYELDVATPGRETVQGFMGTKVVPTKDIAELEGYDLLVLPGGAKAMEYLRQDKRILNHINNAHAAGKVIASICHGSQLLISAGVVKGEVLSGYYSIKDDINNAGAVYMDLPVVVSHNIITSPHYKHLGTWMKRTLRQLENKPKYNAVLFDLDGTLAQTMEETYEAWNYALGYKLKAEDFYCLEGTPVFELAKKLGGNSDTVEAKEKFYQEHHSFSLYPGVEDLILTLRYREIPIALVTTGQANRINGTVPSEFLGWFDAVIVGEDSIGKPSPDPYIKAAHKLGVHPSECMVVENAPLGIQSAKAAGAYCVAVATILGGSYLKQADKIVRSIQEVKALC